MYASNSKEMRLDSECIDRISNLPDAILGQILSYLPIEKVIATSILSTRWKSLFPTHVPLTELVLEDYKSDTPSQNFIDFVDNLLFATLSDVPRVEKVVIASETKYHDYLIDSWVRGALELNVEHLRLLSNLEDSAYVFDSLYGCETLVELEIGGDFRLLIPEGFFLPNLKRLTLYSVLPLEDPNSVQELMDGCPVLDELNFSGCNLCCLENLYIRHPLITKLCIERSFYEAGCKIVIDAPKLEAFAYEGHFVANYDMKNVESLHSVCIEFDIFSQDAYEEGYRSKARRLAKLVKGCSRTARLCLSGNSLTALYRSRVPLPTLQNVTCLALGRMGSHGLKFLAHLFKNVPSLTTLIFEEKVRVTRTFADFISTLQSLRVIAELHVKKIEIWDFEGRQDEIEFIACLLKNGRVLQELIVHCLPCMNTSALEKLSMLPRCSKACQVLLRGNAKRGESRYARSNWF